MSTYYLAPSLVALRSEINERFLKRDKSSDGWIGDPSHQARKSDHNPDWDSGGVVRAIDIDIDDNDSTQSLAELVLKAAIGDARVWYVIHKGTIWSRTYGWSARKYTGNPHDGHIHISVQHTREAERDTSSWLAPTKKKRKPLTISLRAVRDQFKAAVEGDPVHPTPSVRRVQRLLGLKADGLVGSVTLEAWRKHEAKSGGSGRPRVPDSKSLRALARGKYQVIQ